VGVIDVMGAVVPAVTSAERRRRLAARHLLAPGARGDDVAAITDAVVALHSSDPASVHLSATARMATPSIAAVEHALYEQRSVIRHHAMRRTLWVMTPPTARAAHASCTEALAAVEWKKFGRFVEEAGISEDGAAWVDAARSETLHALRRVGTSSARALAAEVPALTAKLFLATGKPYAGTQGAHTRALQNLGFDGDIVRTRPRGSWVTAEYAWAIAEDWLPGGIVGMDGRTAAAELVRRYLDRFGPATTADVQWWCGWTLARTKAALTAVDAQSVSLDDGASAWVLPGDDAETAADDRPWIALLPALDPTVMGWKERRWYLGEHGAFGHDLFDRNGNAGPSIWMDGRVVGGWAQRKDGSIVHELFDDLPRRRRRDLADAIARAHAIVGDVCVRPRFPAPMQARLLAT
jgi:hypothetical protein